MKYWAKVTTRFEGIHNYPAAPAGVEFLKNPHRHEFHVTLHVQQFHTNRDVEYILLKRKLEEQIKQLPAMHIGPLPTPDFQTASCEWIGEQLLLRMKKFLDEQDSLNNLRLAPERDLHIEVTEDGENGAIVKL